MKTTWTQTYAPFRQYAKTVFYIMNIFESQYSICTRFYNLHVKDWKSPKFFAKPKPAAEFAIFVTMA